MVRASRVATSRTGLEKQAGSKLGPGGGPRVCLGYIGNLVAEHLSRSRAHAAIREAPIRPKPTLTVRF